MVELSDGRLMAIGIQGSTSRMARSVVRILDADLRDWSADLPGMRIPRHDVILSRVPEGNRILAAGGFAANPWHFDPKYGGRLPSHEPNRLMYGYLSEDENEYNRACEKYDERMEGFDKTCAVTTVESWDPDMEEWSDLTDNVSTSDSDSGSSSDSDTSQWWRGGAGGHSCVLPSGNVMIRHAHCSTDYPSESLTGELYTPFSNSWTNTREPSRYSSRAIPGVSQREGSFASLLPVAGGCIAIAENAVAVYDEHSNHWFLMTRDSPSWRTKRNDESQLDLVAWDPWIESIVFATVIAQDASSFAAAR
jgi:hypothetical protein